MIDCLNQSSLQSAYKITVKMSFKCDKLQKIILLFKIKILAKAGSIVFIITKST
ncbi:hypothetical protein E9M_05480 [Moraxella catarrhalis 46P47B1]|nr:hypothetical protein EJK52_0251 [Moraxella catarrhalis]EGE11936.1 hypothetical protein E9G_02682 [Moraxella catarrhalis 7169]EGE12368.1 hypothetical protein E9M_05480 [Moraxella catarrhalis 46P47B1]EGE15167.1 hypothetical protein E9O_05386 [Moraxella catarrhalis 12P80B1]EGE15515.1 hypothetical protein E9K_03148 [Moraxella catarrhalis 103P14B1]EGE18135.1 hypothetical protein E9S_09400 [Moraxella catarrhalis BC7]EGE20615.1 hypothetical protein E9Q_00864 [Moraxella catarrhalis BC1]EGE20762.1